MTTVNEHLTIGLQHARSYNYGKAENEFDLLLSSDRTHTCGLYYRGCTRIYLNKFELAVEDFNLAISSLNLSLECELLALYKRGFAYQKLYKFDFALDNYRKFLNQAKENNKDEFIHKAYFSIGTIHAVLNRHEEAVRYFDDAIRTSGNSREGKEKLYYLHRGRARAFCANFNEAGDDFHIVILQSKNPLLQGCAYNELGQHEKALQEYNHWYESPSRNDNKLSPLLLEILDDHVQLRRGLTYASLNRHDNAIADYQYIFNKSNRLTASAIADRIFFRKGMSSMALNDVHVALISFNKSILLNSSQSDVFYARGMLHFTLGRHDAAVYDHRQALELGESNSIISSIYQTFYHTHNYNPNNVDPRIFHQKQVREAEAALKRRKEEGLPPEEQHRRIAEYQQQLAPYMPNPEETHRQAEKHIQQALQSAAARQMYDKITLAINHLRTSQMLSNKYPAGIASERIVKEFIKSSMDSIVEMSEILGKCALENNWNDLFDIFYELKEISPTKTNNPFFIFRSEYIQIEFKKAELIKKTSEKFKDSPQQHEFYTLLVLRLCNLFDATRIATTGIFQHTLTGTFTKISYIPQLLGYLGHFIPVFGGTIKAGLGICGGCLKKLDQSRIQEALTHVGCLDQQEKLYEAANTISEKLTMMYESQLERFPALKDDDGIMENSVKKASCCHTCCQSCCNCCKKSKAWIPNERENSNMQSIVEYAFDLLVNSLTDLEVSKVNAVADLNDFFINSICHLSYRPKIYCHITTTKIQPKDTTNEEAHWSTYDFFRGPGIRFKADDIRVDKHMDVTKFGFREPSWEEIRWYKNNPNKLNDLGLNKYNKN
ncbi:unnamed protein product [Rotaria socialis]|uniref:Uncharacterized protein n=3 Tax=Rotaria socialis TaxID=392032 RepID=A0A817NUI1_9BILA|nr:unnamed protein product [Rotaria socialis]CAF3372440.1 unnamed protein product [Rotaria socialis]CAF3410280.1 unnamed protein product [Rotaria socialis]CAF3554879.1 unnamed protein product [Rotaria socialis]CAF4375698.1 unnamed protein product [Rotaria socialis]